jgi:MFS family permease
VGREESGDPETMRAESAEAPAATGSRQRADAMFRRDLVRGGAQGAIETCWQTFALLILIRVFAADETVKQNVPAAFGYGLLLGPFILAWVGRRNWNAARYAACLWLGIAAALFGAAFIPNLYVFLGAIMLGQILAAQAVPIFTHLYSRNYRTRDRGQRLSTAVLLTSISGMVFGFAGGLVLDLRPETLSTYPLIFVGAGLAALVGAAAVRRMPAEPLAALATVNLTQSLGLAWRDRVFRWLLIGWMMMGLGNLMVIPLRVELLANESYGINASNTAVAFLMAFLVPLFRLLSTYFWGMIFDRINLITVRLALNGCFVLSMYLFFFSDSLWVMGVGAAILGVAFGGGSVMWTLWVTKVAPPGKVSTYMSVHGFFTGFRASSAPLIGYTLLEALGPRGAALVGMGLILLSSLVFLPLRPALERYRRKELTEA